MSKKPRAALVPPEVDLRGYEFVPLYGQRLRDSDFNSSATDAEYRARLNLLWSAWQQVPAASLPNDDIALCKLADLGRDVKTWRRVKAKVLRGFILCSDGRWYHPFLAMLALSAFDARSKARARGIAGASKRWSSRSNAQSTEIDGKGEERERIGETAAARAPARDPVDKESAAAATTELIYPGKLTHAQIGAAGKFLNGNAKAQLLLDELTGILAKKDVRDPVAMLVKLSAQERAGQFMPSHAHRVQVEREGRQAQAEFAQAEKKTA